VPSWDSKEEKETRFFIKERRKNTILSLARWVLKIKGMALYIGDQWVVKTECLILEEINYSIVSICQILWL